MTKTSNNFKFNFGQRNADLKTRFGVNVLRNVSPNEIFKNYFQKIPFRSAQDF